MDDDGNYIGKWGYCNETACGIKDCPSNQRCVVEDMCEGFSDLKKVREYKAQHNESLAEINRELEDFPMCERDKICCGSILVAGKTVDELNNLPYPDLKRIFHESLTQEKALILESVDERKRLFESTTTDEKQWLEDKQYILSNHPQVFAQTVESFTWERRARQEDLSKAIDSIVQETFEMDFSFGGSSTKDVHELLLENRVTTRRKGFLDHLKKFREKYTQDRDFCKRMDGYYSRNSAQTGSSSDTDQNFKGGIRGLPRKLMNFAKNEKKMLTKYAASNKISTAMDVGIALWKGNAYFGALKKQAGVKFENKLAGLGNSIQGVAGGVKKIKGGDTITKVSGVMDILGSISTFAGSAGPFISGACGFVNVILDLVGVGGPSLQEQMGEMIKEQTKQIQNMIETQTDEIKNKIDAQTWEIKEMIDEQTAYIHKQTGVIISLFRAQADKNWITRISDLIKKVDSFRIIQMEKIVFMDTILSGGGDIPSDEVQMSSTFIMDFEDDHILTEARLFFEEECSTIGYKLMKKESCDKLLFSYIGLAIIRDVNNMKLVSVLAAANLNLNKRAVLALIEEKKSTARKHLIRIFNATVRTDSCHDCPFTVFKRGLMISTPEVQMIFKYVASLGIVTQASEESCEQTCTGNSRIHPVQGHNVQDKK